jgi:hypothetical protein
LVGLVQDGARERHPAGSGGAAFLSVSGVIGVFVTCDDKRQACAAKRPDQTQLVLVRLNPSHEEDVVPVGE